MRIAAVLAAFGVAQATAAPLEVAHRGLLRDADGVPLDGAHTLTATLYDAANAAVWTRRYVDVAVAEGHYALTLGDDGLLDGDDLARGPLYLGIAVDAAPEMPLRTQLYAAPFVALADGVRLSNVVTCDAASAGMLRWNGTAVQVCTGTAWTNAQPGPQVAAFGTPGSATFTVPAGVTSLTIKAWGGGGGGGNVSGATGGAGGYASGTFVVTPGEVLQVRVAGGGGGWQTRTGGVNGGGNGASYNGTSAPGGGGYSGVFRGTPSQATALVVAGGGGGGGINLARWGGAGGGTEGSGGNCGNTLGATQSGPGGSSSGSGGPYGSALQGAVGASNDETYAGAGGGGGYWGGGGGWTGTGSGCNGGGGSGFVKSGATSASLQTGTDAVPGNPSDADRAGAADGAPFGNNAGDAGRVVLRWIGN